MAKLIVQCETDPDIAIIIEGDGDSGYRGCCTECGPRIRQYWQGDALKDADAHIRQHEADANRATLASLCRDYAELAHPDAEVLDEDGVRDSIRAAKLQAIRIVNFVVEHGLDH